MEGGAIDQDNPIGAGCHERLECDWNSRGRSEISFNRQAVDFRKSNFCDQHSILLNEIVIFSKIRGGDHGRKFNK